jgi:RimJ/RimL family protein N-acetyltransferase
VLTPRVQVRLPVEQDRERFVELFCDERFMVFSGVLDIDGAHRRFDEMLERSHEIPFAKQPIIERQTATIVGYAGVDWFDFDGERCLEFGYRLVPEARGSGYATEASRLLLAIADDVWSGEIVAMIDPRNAASHAVAAKLGFTFWKQAVVDGVLDDLISDRSAPDANAFRGTHEPLQYMVPVATIEREFVVHFPRGRSRIGRM